MSKAADRASLIAEIEGILARLKRDDPISIMMAYDGPGGAQVMIYASAEQASLIVMTAMEAVQANIRAMRTTPIIENSN